MTIVRLSVTSPLSQRLNIALMAALIMVVLAGGAIGMWSPAALLTVGALLGVMAVPCSMIRPEVGVGALLVVWSLGMETLDLSSLFVQASVPRGSITIFHILMCALLLALTLRSIRAQIDAPPRKNDGDLGKVLGVYLAVALTASILAALLVPFARIEWSLVYLLRMALTFAAYIIVVGMAPSRAWQGRYLYLYVFLVCVPAMRALTDVWFPGGESSRLMGADTVAGFSKMGLGTYLGSVIGICIAAIDSQRHNDQLLTPRVAWFMLLLSATLIVLTQKRAPVVGLLVICLVWFKRQPHRRWLILSVLGLAVCVAWLRGGILDRTFLDDPGLAIWLARLDQREVLPAPLWFLADYHLDPNITVRIAQWSLALQAAIQYPLGVGFRGMVLSPYSYPHNQYLQILAESSVIGLMVFMYLLRSVFNLAARLSSQSGGLGRFLGSGIFYGFVGLLTQGMFEEAFHNWDGVSALMFLVGLGVVYLRSSATGYRRTA